MPKAEQDRIRELEGELVLSRAESSGSANKMLEIRDEYVALNRRKTAVSKLGNWVKARDSTTVEYLQANMAFERFSRDNYGGVETLSASFFPTTTAIPIDELLERLAELFGCPRVLKDSSDLVRYNLALIVGDVAVGQLSREFHESQLSKLFVAARTEEFIDSVLETVREAGYTIGSKEDADGIIPVTFATPAVHGVNLINREFKQLPLDEVEGNYTPAVIESARQAIKNVVEGAKSGLIILNGDPGTGKTYLIRALLSELKARHAVVCTPPGQFLGRVDMLAQASQASDKKPIMVLEDIGDMLSQENVVSHMNETSNFLNLTDGLLSLLTDIIFIVSFNHDMSKINPALTRPGRCLGQIAVGKLPFDQVKGLLDGKPELTTHREFTLAEVYEMRNTGKILKEGTAVSVMPGMGRAS